MPRTCPQRAAFRPPRPEGNRTRVPAHSVLWVPSQSGIFPERLHVQNRTFFDAGATHSIGVNGVPSCEPSQNGWAFERPHAHHQ